MQEMLAWGRRPGNQLIGMIVHRTADERTAAASHAICGM
jgi:hypothetical protein